MKDGVLNERIEPLFHLGGEARNFSAVANDLTSTGFAGAKAAFEIPAI
jgi:hypothetical protein